MPEAPTGPPPGVVICLKEKIKLNVGRKRWMVEVRNEGDRPIQVSRESVGFHYLYLFRCPSAFCTSLIESVRART